MNGAPGTLLILEDDPQIAMLEDLALRKAGYRTVLASRQAEALEKIGQGGIDLILLDFQLSEETTGIDFHRALLQRGILLPAILVTSFGDEKIIIEAMRAGIRDFLPKTSEYLNYLAPTVERVLRQARAERELAESRTLRESEERLKAALRASQTGTFRWDIANDIFHCDENLNRLLGCEPGRTVHFQAQFLARVHPADRTAVEYQMTRSREPGSDFGVEFRVLRPGGSAPWLLANGSTTPESDAPCMTGACVDITTRKEAEREILSLNADLEKRVLERTSRLAESNQELEAFTYTVAHDLRAPIRAMRSFSEILEQDYGANLDAIGRDFLARINQSASRMDELVKDLLSYSQATREEISLERVNLDEVVDEIVQNQQHLLHERNVTLDVRRPLHDVMAHRVTLVQAIINLFDNAAKFVPKGVAPKILVYSEPRDGEVRLWVCDNGIGIDPAYHRRIFNVFERLHTGREYSGTGIGLAMVRRVVARMGGEVGVESKTGEGSKFWIVLPAG